jgi:pimeloyl-ACP methyl ester carboxylesterase
MSPVELKEGTHEYDVAIGGARFNFLCDFDPEAGCMLVFLHGLACSRNTFRFALEHRYFPGCSLFLPDLIGFGSSAKPDEFSYTMDDQAALCERVLAQLPPVKLHVVGHSMGGAIGLLFSPRLFGRIRTFANVEGNLIAEDCGMLSRGIADVPFKRYRSHLFEEHKARFADDFVLEFSRTTPEAMHRSACSMVEWSDSGKLLTLFRRLPCRTGYFWGEKNHDMPILQRLRGIDTFMIGNSGHGMMIDNPGEFYSRIAEFIAAQA